MFDYDGDGDLDIYLVQGGLVEGDNNASRNRLFRNDGSGHFEDVSDGSGADLPGYGMGCAAADFDNDGDVDLYVTRLGANALLLNNGDGTFRDVTVAAGVGDPGFGTAAAFVDFDRDGFLDLYLVNYVEWSSAIATQCYDRSGAEDYCSPTQFPPAQDRLYRNTGRFGAGGGETWFEDVSVAAGIAQVRGNGLAVACTDFDGDGWVDIYVANDQTPAFLWINKRDGTFREDAALAGCAFSGDGMAIAGMGVAVEDLDGDGDFDLMVTNIRAQTHLLLQNDGGLFEDVSYARGLGSWSVPYTGFGIALFDQDHDGELDGFVANGAVNRWIEPLRSGHPFVEPNHFFRHGADGRFLDCTAEAGLPPAKLEMSRGVIVGDYDNDGDIDVLITNNRGPVQLLRNENGSTHAWTMLDLLPATGSRHAINAIATVEAGGRTYLREVRPHVGYLGSNDPRLHVGLGSASGIDRLTVRWADGTSETWSNLPVNRHLRVRQGHDPETISTGSVEEAAPKAP